MRRFRVIPLGIALVVLLLLVACRAPAPAATPTPTPPPAAAPTPAASPIPPAPGITPTPTPVIVSTPTPTPTPVVARVVERSGYEGHPSPQAKYGGTFRTFVERGPGSCDLAFRPQRGRVAQNSCGSMFNTLLRYWPKEEIRSDLAERWEVSPDGLEYTFYLQKDVRWHDGKPFTAQDVVYNLKRYMEPPPGQVLSFLDLREAGIKELRAVDETTVKIRLETPNADFLEILAWPAFTMNAPQKLEALTAAGKPPLFLQFTDVVATGPFKPLRFVEESTYEMVKNPDYWVKGLPYLDGIRILVLPDPSTRLAALLTGQADMYQATELTKTDADALKRNPRSKDMTFITYPTGLQQVLFINLKSPLMQDKRVREAIHLATNSNEANRVIGFGEGLVGGGLMPPITPWGLPMEQLQKYPGYGPDPAADLERAKKLLAEVYPQGIEVRPLLSRVTDRDVATAVWVATRLNQIGIKAEGRGVDAAVDQTEITDKRNYDVLGRYVGSSGKISEKMPYFFCDYTPTGNYIQWCNPEYDRLYRVQQSTLDPEKRKQILWQMQHMVLETLGFRVLNWTGRNAAWWSYVKNYNPAALSQYVHNATRYDLIWIER